MRRLVSLALAATLATAAAGAGKDVLDFGEKLYRYLPESGGRDAPFTPTLRALIARDAAARAASGAPATMPLCDCTAFAKHYHLTNLRAHLARAGRATLLVTFDNGGAQDFRLDLVRQDGGWAIADVHGPRTPSLLAALSRAPQP